MHECPECAGVGHKIAMFPVYAPHVPQRERKAVIEIDCQLCKGSGAVDDEALLRKLAGAALRRERLAQQIGLRQFANKLGVSPVMLSQVEQGIIYYPDDFT